MSTIDHDEMLAILTAGARLKPERSRALPASSYGDPSKVVKLASEQPKRRKEKPSKPNKKWRK